MMDSKMWLFFASGAFLKLWTTRRVHSESHLPESNRSKRSCIRTEVAQSTTLTTSSGYWIEQSPPLPQWTMPKASHHWRGLSKFVPGAQNSSTWPWEVKLVNMMQRWREKRMFNKTVFFLNGEPKSGTSWFEMVVRSLAQLCPSIKSCNSQGSVAWSHQMKHVIPMVGHETEIDYHVPEELSDAQVDAAARRAIERLPMSWIAIIRDPRAVVVSACHHEKKGIPSCDNYARRHIKATAKWIDLRHRFILSVIRQTKETRQTPRAILVFYESLKSTFPTEVRKLSRYMLGSALSDEQIKMVANKTTLDKVLASFDHTKARKGEACGFMGELREDTIAYINEVMRQSLSADLRGVWHC